MRAFEEYLQSKGYSSTTISGYRKDAERFSRWIEEENLSIEHVGYSDILHYMQIKKGHVKQRTQSVRMNSLRHYFAHLSSKGWVGEDPTRQVQIKGVKRSRLYDILDREELDGLYHLYEWKEDRKHEGQNWYEMSKLCTSRNKVIIGLLVYQGLTVTEIGRLKEKDLKLREAKVFIAGGRRSNERTMLLDSVQILDMMEYVMKDRLELMVLSSKDASSESKERKEQLVISTGGGTSVKEMMKRIVQKLHEIDSRISSLKQIRGVLLKVCQHFWSAARSLGGRRPESERAADSFLRLEPVGEFDSEATGHIAPLPDSPIPFFLVVPQGQI